MECAQDAEHGAAMALNCPPDAIVSDLWMPGLSGLQLCRLLRDAPETTDVPLVLLTAAGDRRARFWAAESGASAFVDKSHIEEVPALLSKLVTGRVPRPGRTSARVDERSIPARLSHLLDRALFDSVLSNKLRGLAAERGDVAGLFAGLSELLCDVIAYRWLALLAGDPPILYVQAHPADRAAVDQALRAMEKTTHDPIQTVLDERCVPPGHVQGAVLTHRLEHAGAQVGVIAMAMDRDPPRADDASVFRLTACEITLPLRLVTLLEYTQRLALTDALTGLPNRRAGMEALQRALAASVRHGHPLSVCLIDIDHFKRINDVYGHSAGDATLRHVATVLRRCIRRSDVAVRWGGEEFLVIASCTPLLGARVMAERIRTALALTPVILEDGRRVEVTASLGVAMHHGEDLHTLLDRADQALYSAKRSGRNRVELAPDPTASSQHETHARDGAEQTLPASTCSDPSRQE